MKSDLVKPRPNSWRLRVIVGLALAVALLAIAGAWILSSSLSSAVIHQQQTDLFTLANVDALALEKSTTPLSSLVTTLADTSNARVTVIATDGTVLADSDSSAASMENHLERPEVKQALKNGSGSDRRVSATEDTEQLYVATQASYRNEEVVLRLSAQVGEVVSSAAAARNAGLLLLGGAFILALAIGGGTLLYASRPVEHLETVRSDFVANASHELKTPVAGIRLLSGTVEAALEDGDTEAAREFAGRIEGEAIKLQHLIGDLLDLSRVENEDANIQETTDARSVITEVMESATLHAERKGLSLELIDEASIEDTCRIKLSARDLSLALSNLIENAINYTEHGGVSLRLVPHERTVTFEVSDTGVGIAPANLSRIFERFYRTDEARVLDASGTGLGLALTKHIAENSGGSISASSEVGVGTVFTLTVPRV